MKRNDQLEYRIWIGMKTRCYNHRRREYQYYGGRGIRICDRWKDSFDAFLSDMGPIPGPEYSIERVNNDGNYEPGNCVWIPRRHQNRNMRHSPPPHLAERDMCAQAGVNYDAWRWRVRHGMTQKEALTKPFIKKKWDRLLDQPVTIEGKTMPAREWIKVFGKHRDTYRHRVRCGMSPEQALKTPLTNLGRYQRKTTK